MQRGWERERKGQIFRAPWRALGRAGEVVAGEAHRVLVEGPRRVSTYPLISILGSTRYVELVLIVLLAWVLSRVEFWN